MSHEIQQDAVSFGPEPIVHPEIEPHAYLVNTNLCTTELNKMGPTVFENLCGSEGFLTAATYASRLRPGGVSTWGVPNLLRNPNLPNLFWISIFWSFLRHCVHHT